MTALYNEIDEYAADWLEALIARGLIAPGVVDRRSVEDLPPDYVSRFTQVHLFAGIGVWSYAARLAGISDDRPLWTLSCPCQPFSAAGKGGGFADERHLWPAAFHLIEQCRPGRLYGEQVADRGGLAWLDLVSADLEGTGYAFGAVDTCSAGFGAPHRRQRLRFTAVDNASVEGLEGLAGNGRSVVGWSATARPVAEASALGSMADDERDRRGTWRDDHTGDERQQPYTIDLFGRLADTEHDGRWSDVEGRETQKRIADRRSSAIGGMADTGDRTGQRGEPRSIKRGLSTQFGPDETDRPRPTNGFWRVADWLLCRDPSGPKWRPVEPCTFPLAHGATSRVGRLRAYGNAVDAQATKAFIEATL